jgi:hypothetical protein
MNKTKLFLVCIGGCIGIFLALWPVVVFGKYNFVPILSTYGSYAVFAISAYFIEKYVSLRKKQSVGS